MKSLLFGTAGIPVSCSGNTIDGIRKVRELGLDAMELEFVHSVNISKETAPKVKETASKNNVLLTCHGQYYINLNAVEEKKIQASIERILNAARTAYACGAYSLTFHAGFYLKQPPQDVYKNIKAGLKRVFDNFDDDLWIRPETTGKPSQWGTIKEIVNLSQEFEKVLPCVDFSHLHARSAGAYNTCEEIRSVLELIENELGREAVENMHMHMSGIDYSEKGEKKHLILKESDMNYKAVLQVLKEFRAKGVLICESPNIEYDAILMKNTYDSM